jgi:hypothetical protein
MAIVKLDKIIYTYKQCISDDRNLPPINQLLGLLDTITTLIATMKDSNILTKLQGIRTLVVQQDNQHTKALHKI